MDAAGSRLLVLLHTKCHILQHIYRFLEGGQDFVCNPEEYANRIQCPMN